ncbi:hypothetical protein TSOC_000759 [Tetrabaena socialis]|uniref:Uncharacterized protein n=1 Tax=Tetrabaena socialis TaxID=47790 RepID=A0A2J8AIF8_9CHLO|nr:hypothetical protein TSOC_000759 [Tetrabaena socialis]|eukprot:PNH12295.1 hypothetical protein TSOC_000759 [Tetrabaena socialis]
MEVGSPRSPPAQFSVCPEASCSYACPSAPRKPVMRRQQAIGNFADAVSSARDQLSMMGDEERPGSLRHLPRHTLEGVFLAFVHYQAGSQLGLGFQDLLALAPCLEQELLDHVQRSCPSITWEEWALQVQQAVSDPQSGQKLAERIMSESFPARRLLF